MDLLVSAAEANRPFSRVLRDVRAGRSCVVTAHGEPVARIVPYQESPASQEASRATLLQRLSAQKVTDIGQWRRHELYEH